MGKRNLSVINMIDNEMLKAYQEADIYSEMLFRKISAQILDLLDDELSRIIPSTRALVHRKLAGFALGLLYIQIPAEYPGHIQLRDKLTKAVIDDALRMHKSVTDEVKVSINKAKDSA